MRDHPTAIEASTSARVDELLAEALELLEGGKRADLLAVAGRLASARVQLASVAAQSPSDLAVEALAWGERWEGAARELHLQHGGASAAWDRHYMTAAAAILAAAGFRPQGGAADHHEPGDGRRTPASVPDGPGRTSGSTRSGARAASRSSPTPRRRGMR